MALDAQILLSILAHETSGGDISRTLRATPASYSLILSDGTGANQAQVVWSDARTIAPLSTDVLDLGGLTDDRGTVALSAVKLIYIRATAAVPIRLYNTGDWSQGPNNSPGAFEYEIPVGGVWLVTNPGATGWAVPANGSDTLSLQNDNAIEATYEIILIGEGTVT